MTRTSLRVLVIEDNPGDVRLLREMLADSGLSPDIVAVSRLDAGLAELAHGQVDVVLLDLSLPDSAGLATFLAVNVRAQDVPIVVLSGLDDEALALRAVQDGAQDYLVKGQVDGLLLGRSIRYAIQRKRAEKERDLLLAREQAARRDAEAAQQRLAFLADVSAALSASLDYEPTMRTVVQLAVPTVADCCILAMFAPDSLAAQPTVAHIEPQQAEAIGDLLRAAPIRLDDLGRENAEALRSGQYVHIERVTQAAALSEEQGEGYRRLLHLLQPTSIVIVPLVARDRTLGTLLLFSVTPERPLSREDLALAEEIAVRAALAIDNARLYQAAQDAIHVRDDFLAAAAHDLKTPLTALRGFAELLRRRLARQQLENVGWLEHGLDRIDASVIKMTAMIQEILDLSRLEGGQPLNLQRRPTDLVALARKSAGEHQQATTLHHITVAADLEPIVGQWDATRLERVLDNLLSNAIKYTPNGGSIRVGIRQEPPWIMLEVRDQGVGIPAADLPHVFERYRRGSNVEGRIPGMGIGLWGVQHVMRAHDGDIAIESREGEGTCVTVRLPFNAEPRELPEGAVGIARPPSAPL